MFKGRRKSDARWAILRDGPRCVLLCRFFALSASLVCGGSAVAAPPGAVISNTASVNYVDTGGSGVTVLSNTVSVTTSVVRSPAGIEFTRVLAAGTGSYLETVGPVACSQGGSFIVLPDPLLAGGQVVDPAVPQSVSAAPAYNLGEPMFVRLTDSDQNLDFQALDTAVVTVVHDPSGDTEILRLTETGPDTGVFAGYVPSAQAAGTSGNCVLEGSANTSARVSYTDPSDASDAATAAALLSPVSIVFESRTGTPVDGALVQIVDAVTGAPATVYGIDGVSTYPSGVTTGMAITDGSGTVYSFGPGEYRFPVVPDGDYRLIVVPPADYAFPSAVEPAVLQALPGAPYALGPASFGAAFTQAGGPGLDWDIPVDPRPTALFLRKTTVSTVAAPGDFVRYALTIENASELGTATDIDITDSLPQGVRYVRGSTTLDGNAAPDPDVAPDQQSLVFKIAALAEGARAEIAYVVEIVGGRRNAELVNRAVAFAGGGLLSNEATATIRLTEDLFRSTGTIIGRVVEGECSDAAIGDDRGVAGVRIYLEDGRYAVTDEGGRYHFEGVEAGTHVAQLDTFTVPPWYEASGCDVAPGFAGRKDSQFVKLSRGALLRADFFVQPRPRPEGRVDLELRSSGTDSTEEVAYTVTVKGTGNVRVRDIDVLVLLPEGVAYRQGTLMIDGQQAAEPRARDGMLALSLPEQSGNWASRVEFIGSIDPATSGKLTTRASAKFTTAIGAGQQTPVAETSMVREPAVSKNEGYVLDLKFAVLSAELSAEDKLQLDLLIEDWEGVRDIRINATGHSDSQPVAERNRHLFADNYALSQARAMSAAFYIADALGVPVEDVTVAGRGPDEAVATNETAAGRQANRRVEMVLAGVRPSRPSFLEVTQASSGTKIVPTQGAFPGEDEALRRGQGLEFDENEGLPASQVEPELESLQPGVAMLLPAAGFRPAIPSTKLSIQHFPGQTVKVYVNEQPVSALNFDAVAISRNGRVAVSRWKGVDLLDGNNTIRVVVSNADGSRERSLQREIYFAGPAIRGEFVSELSTLVADGKTRPVIAVRLFDRAGQPSRAGTVGNYRVDAPYRSWWDVEDARRNDLVAIGPREPVYRVGADGIALIELEPTTRSGELTFKLKFDHQREQELRAWLSPAGRDWILVGFAEGTAGYNTLSQNAEAAALAGEEDGYVDQGRVAFFAKGSIRGDYLLTLAYDSVRDRQETRGRFETVVDPAQYYPLYADTSEQRYEAPSQRKLYVKLERGQFNLLFGDFDSGLSVTDLARYERRFNGLRAEYRGETLGYTAFAAESNQAYHRDEIRGDGTSGLYRLSSAPLVMNSETVRIEVRDRLDSARVVSETRLARFLDYDLDPLRGTVFFKQPVPSRDLQFNPVYIVVEYETVSAADDDIVAGARVSARTAGDAVEVGVTGVRDDTSGAEAELQGIDLRWQVNAQTLVKAEYAESNAVKGGLERDGAAHSIEIEHNGERVDLDAYIREVDEGFGVGYQSAADRGFRRVGVDLRAGLGDRWHLDTEAAWQQNLETADIRNLARMQVRYERRSLTAMLGVTHAEDRFDDGESRSSDLAEVGLAQRLFDNRLTLRAGSSSALSGEAESTDFPSRYVVGADYRVLANVELVSEYEDASGPGIDATMTRLGVKATPWQRAQVNSFVTNEITEFGPRLFANVGLVQGFQLNERWSLDVGVDQSNTLSDADSRMFDPDRERVSGSLDEDFTAAFAGAMYTADAWSANSRLEFRNADSEERAALLIGWYREPSAGHGLSAGLTVMSSDHTLGNELTSANLKVGWAYRPGDRDWAFLNRTDFVYEDAVVDGAAARSWRFVSNLNANRRLGAAAQLSLQYAFKYVRTEFDDDGYSGFTDLVGVDYRRGFRPRWDVGINASVYHAYRPGVLDYGLGADVGFNVRDNMWLTLGYNVAGFHDTDFAEARYTAQGPFLRFSIKADQHTLRSIAGR